LFFKLDGGCSPAALFAIIPLRKGITVLADEDIVELRI